MKLNTKMSRWVLATAIVALVLVSWSPVLAAKPDRTNILVVQLALVGTTEPFDFVASDFGGPFYVGGILVDPDTGEQIGLFHCWGFFFGQTNPNQRMVTQEFDLFDRGRIILAGREGPPPSPGGRRGNPRAITGGTEDFKNVRGQATFLGGGLVSFELMGADAD